MFGLEMNRHMSHIRNFAHLQGAIVSCFAADPLQLIRNGTSKLEIRVASLPNERRDNFFCKNEDTSCRPMKKNEKRAPRYLMNFNVFGDRSRKKKLMATDPSPAGLDE